MGDVQSEIKNPTGEALVASLEELPALPESCLKLGALIENPNSSAKDLAQVIETDAALATRILRLANSAYYAVREGVDSLQHAISLVGFSAVHQVALCALSHDALTRKGRTPTWLRAHGTATSELAALAAMTVDPQLVPSASSAGLIHDLGYLALFAARPQLGERWQAEMARGASDVIELDWEILGISHEALGGALARRWRFPPLLLAVIEDHHGGGSGDGSPGTRLSDLVAVADGWSHQQGLGFPGLDLEIHTDRLERTGLEAHPPLEEA